MSLLKILFLLFLAVPIIEIYLLIQVGSLIGAIPTIALVVFTAVLGALLLRRQGFQTLMRARASMERGEIPAVQMLEGVVLLISGALLLTPGFFTDALGFAGLIPPLRRRAIHALLARGVIIAAGGYRPGPHRGPGQGPYTIEGDFRREDNERD